MASTDNQTRWTLMAFIDAAGDARDLLDEPAVAGPAANARLERAPRAHPGFASVLSAGRSATEEAPPPPDCFGDLHLDQIVACVTSGFEEYDLASFFYRRLHTVEEVRYRHQVLCDLERPDVLALVRSFGERMREMRKQLALAQKLQYQRQKERWFLSAVSVYRDAVCRLAADLDHAGPTSAGLVGLREHVTGYLESAAFTQLSTDIDEVNDKLVAVRYAVEIRGSRVRVSAYEEATDLAAEVEQTFEKFKQGAVKDYRIRFRRPPELNHIEAQILELVARLHPESFSRLQQFYTQYQSCFEKTIMRFDREVQFYLAYLKHIDDLKSEKLRFCLPEVVAGAKDVHAQQGFDLSLAAKLAGHATPVVCNDFELSGPERVLVVTGPNQGGKTTFARMFGQLHYLASLGLPVPAKHARLALVDRLFTHFEREESLQTLRGKFEDELVRIHQILLEATSDSLLIMNESFGSTTLNDALHVGTAVVRQIIDLDAVCVFVTFVDELASLDEATVSMMSTVDPDDPAKRTYKVGRKAADGLAYAAALAEKYGLAYDTLRRRIVR